MVYLIIAIFCSVVVSVNLKLLKRYYTNSFQAIVFNYPTALLLSLFLFRPNFQELPSNNQLLIFGLMALMMLSLFYFISKSVQSSGIVVTAIGQRLSLIIPVLAAFIIFNESISWLKILGLFLGFLAIYFSVPKAKFSSDNINYWYPFIVFFGTGVLDIFFNMITQFSNINFTTCLFYIFAIATIMGAITLVYLKLAGKLKFQMRALFAGVVLGFFNFSSIYFYIKALAVEPDKPSIIFSAMDIGVIASGSIVGFFMFKEKLSMLNKVGIILAIIAICILTFA
ncbi:protein of unknown function DUF6 transmembrane [Pseudopedobacter saltans DSM 12145]|uniref:EamA domain-containing protein n=1 Tax=Pseudopedobacter saltans (strain ATCC 51119 / DSM 12145 / JCM 21818 / CCUG 39354 / LMG 10337 / NBRC 100064 / NCIMB 13643) TaxID=762903 RepID=F0SAA0_PSESL|nr:EamA family transporter [Pseudopedobacter saltans]ADY51477.1 protein of unknown function DUF6 transmembrane [Pseudopedobacter saltans DSM 12145]